MIDEMYANPSIDVISGKIDSAWVALAKLKVETYIKLLGNDNTDSEMEIDV